jgi:DNA repair exonuclease SbcCD ATPase subunit
LRKLEDQTKHAGGMLPGSGMRRAVLGRNSVSEMLQGKKLPRKALMLTFAEACGADLATDRRWEQAWDRLAVQAQDQPGGAAGRSRPAEVASEIRGLRELLDKAEQSNRELERGGAAAEAMSQSYRAQLIELQQEFAFTVNHLQQGPLAAEVSKLRQELAEAQQRIRWLQGELAEAQQRIQMAASYSEREQLRLGRAKSYPQRKPA